MSEFERQLKRLQAEGPQLPGLVLGEQLGVGGMGRVYRAEETVLKRAVAVKVVERSRLSERGLTRFRREVELLVRCEHPRVMRVYAWGETEDCCYFVGELIEGIPFDEACRERLPGEILELLTELAEVVAAVHAEGVVHRDLKPSNVLVSSGRVKLIDFGIAYAAELERLTQTSEFVGTLVYASPERLMVKACEGDEPMDVWALGVMAYEALAGVRPYEFTTAAQLYQQMRQPPPPISTKLPGLDPAVAAAIDAALRLDPRKRPKAEALAEAFQGPSPSSGPSVWWALVGLALLVVAAAGVFAMRWLPGGAPPAPLAAAKEAPGAAKEAPGAAKEAPTPRSDSAADSAAPGWFTARAAEERPPLPLPAGLEWGERDGDYLHARTGAVLRWVPASLGGSGFFLGKYEVTWSEFFAFCRDTGRKAPLNRLDHLEGGGQPITPGPRHPVVFVDWESATAYCSWAGLRLPTVAEQRRASRGARADRANLRGVEDGFALTAPVGSFPEGAAPNGCLDLVGNVYEWVEGVGEPLRFLAMGRSYLRTMSSKLLIESEPHGTYRDVGFRVALSVTRAPLSGAELEVQLERLRRRGCWEAVRDATREWQGELSSEGLRVRAWGRLFSGASLSPSDQARVGEEGLSLFRAVRRLEAGAPTDELLLKTLGWADRAARLAASPEAEQLGRRLARGFCVGLWARLNQPDRGAIQRLDERLSARRVEEVLSRLTIPEAGQAIWLARLTKFVSTAGEGPFGHQVPGKPKTRSWLVVAPKEVVASAYCAQALNLIAVQGLVGRNASLALTRAAATWWRLPRGVLRDDLVGRLRVAIASRILNGYCLTRRKKTSKVLSREQVHAQLSELTKSFPQPAAKALFLSFALAEGRAADALTLAQELSRQPHAAVKRAGVYYTCEALLQKLAALARRRPLRGEDTAPLNRTLDALKSEPFLSNRVARIRLHLRLLRDEKPSRLQEEARGLPRDPPLPPLLDLEWRQRRGFDSVLSGGWWPGGS